MEEQKAVFFNPVGRHVKEDLRDICITALRSGDKEIFVKAFVYWHLDRENIAKFSIPLTRHLQELTGWSEQSIRRVRRILESKGLLIMKDQKTFTVEKHKVNRLPSTLKEEIEVPERNLTPQERRIWETMSKIDEHSRVYYMNLVTENERLRNRVFDLELTVARLDGKLQERENAETRVIKGYEKGLDKGISLVKTPGEKTALQQPPKLHAVKSDTYEITH